MKRARFTEEQIIGVLREHEAGAKHHLERLDEHDERLAARRDEILRQIERRRSGWAKLVQHASEEIIEGEFHELPSGAPDVGPDRSDGSIGPASGRTRKAKRRPLPRPKRWSLTIDK